ncbi:Tho complex subunit 7-domain-containing protein [Diplogelasinospora grovesii]|uniref:Tho complex subunit 7-domain-containing protein n=1 Tax=Diplogelasinospora grovesii TaxID=303347 RepID=A0AAN6NBJ0_9PEZI|nr:Tho complex subunit 7-domain-containing protein [Diplogelasinospora grovesii]
MSSQWGLLDDKEENELHKSRLLNVEEKPFKRVTKRLSTLHSLATARVRQAPTPPPEVPNGVSSSENHADTPSPADAVDSYTADLLQLKEDMTLDFAAFDSSIARLQFLLTANERERERYAAERERIVNTSQQVRDNTATLRIQLDSARATLEQRKKFDELADKITSNPALKPRTEQAANLRKLEDEISELEAESKTYAVTWKERRDQFARIMEESMRLRRLIRDEKEEVERREGMDEDGEGSGDVGTEAGQTPRPGLASGNATPRPESRSGTGTLLAKQATASGAESGDAGTPRPVSTHGGRTPARESPAPSGQDGHMGSYLKPRPDEHGGSGFSQGGSAVGSREGSPDINVEGDGAEEGGDVEMVETPAPRNDEDEEPDSPLTPLPAEDTPRIVVDDSQEDRMDTT